MHREEGGEPGFVLKEAIREMVVGERHNVAKSMLSKRSRKKDEGVCTGR